MEAKVGYSRAVVVDDTIYISGTPGHERDAYAQTKDALAVIEGVLSSNGFTLADVVHSRLSGAGFGHREDAGCAHGEVRPSFALVHALPFTDDGILVEVEVEANAVRVRP